MAMLPISGVTSGELVDVRVVILYLIPARSSFDPGHGINFQLGHFAALKSDRSKFCGFLIEEVYA